MGEKVIFLGDGVPVCRHIIEETMNVPFEFAPAHVNRQRGASVAALGAVYYEQGRLQTAAEHKPDYLRKSQAEREREVAERQGEMDKLGGRNRSCGEIRQLEYQYYNWKMGTVHGAA